MKKNRKRLSALLLTAALLISMLPVTAWASSTDTVSNSVNTELDADTAGNDSQSPEKNPETGDDPVMPPDGEDVPGGEDDPVVPPAGEDVPDGEDDPVVPPAGEGVPDGEDDPVVPPAGEDVPSGEDDPVVPPADEDVSNDITPPAEDNAIQPALETRAGAPAIPGYTQYTANTLDPDETYLIVTQSSDGTIYALYASEAGKNISPGALSTGAGTCSAILTVNGDTVTAEHAKSGGDGTLEMSSLYFQVNGDSSSGYTFSSNGLGLAISDKMFADTPVSLSVANVSGDYSIRNSSPVRQLSFNKVSDSMSQYPNHITDFWGPGGKNDSFPIYLYTLNKAASKDDLKASIDNAGTLREADYTAASWGALETALAEAQKVYDTQTATEAEIGAALSQLKSAINGLVEKLHPTDPPTTGITEYIQDTDGIDSGAVYAIVSPVHSGNNRILFHTGINSETDQLTVTPSGNKVTLNTTNNFVPAQQLWKVESVSGGYTVQCLDSNYYLDLTQQTTAKTKASSTPVTLNITKTANGTYTITYNNTVSLAFPNANADKFYAGTAESAAELYFFKQTTASAVIEGPGKPAGGTTNGQPFPAGTAGSTYFRIPALVTLSNGSSDRLVAACDARWNHIMDACSLDTIVSYSDDNGKTWHYNFPNYFNDSVNAKELQATAFIDPLMTVGKDGTIYLLADLFPGGFAINTAPNKPAQTSGFVEIGGEQRMPIYTSDSGQTDSNYTYYVGDFSGAYAPILEAYDGSESGYYVDDHYYLYYGASKEPIYCQQLGSDAWVHQNVFYHNADLHVRNATYLWLVKSTDGGATWSAPTILNPQVRRTSGYVHQFYGVGPGAVSCMEDGTLVMPCYTFQSGGANNSAQIASFIYSTDNGVTWSRSEDSTDSSHWSSESATVQIDADTIRHFYRDGYSTLWYTDHTRSGGSWTAGSPVDTGVPNTSNNQLSVLRYSKPIDGKTAILVSTATGSGGKRTNGKIYTFLLNDDKTLSLAYTYAVNDNGADYVYSSLAELKDGSIGLLYEYTNNPKADITFKTYTIGELTASVAKDELQALVDEVKAMVSESYTAESWATLQETLTAAQAVLNNTGASWSEVNAAAADLKAAKSGLEFAGPPSSITTIEYIQDTDGIDSGAVYAIVSPLATSNNLNRILYHASEDANTNQVATTISNGKIALNSGFAASRQLWTVTGSGNSYTIQSLEADKAYLDLTAASSGSINVSSSAVTLTVEQTANGTYTISGGTNVITFDTSTGKFSSSNTGTPAELYFFKQTEIVTEMEIIDGDGRPAPGTTTGQPFPAGTAGSTYFRIPALVTLSSGRLVAACDARWNHIMDACSLDTIVSYSDDNGQTWHYNFPNYFNDSVNAKELQATAFIDPLMTVGKDGTIYLLADLFPGGFAINTAPNRPAQTSGFVEIGGKQRMPIYTSDSGQTDSNYTYYVGDFANGYAPLLNKSDNQESGYYVDDHYYLYHGANKSKLYCQQLGANAWVQQNVFYHNADLHVRNATYLWLVKSTDGGESWSAPTILNPQVRRTSGTVQFYGVGPGAVSCMDDGTLVMPCYTFDLSASNNYGQIASFIYSTDNGVTWSRSEDSTDSSHWSSESATVQIDADTIRHFYRDGYSTLWYTDHTRSEGSWTAGSPVDTGVPNTSNNQLSVLRYSKPIDGKTAILVSTATGSGGSRTNGKIYTFLLNDDKTMSLAYTYTVNDGGADYVYSSLAELKDGSIGLLYEYTNNPKADITFVNYPIETVVSGAILDGKITYQVPLYGTYTATPASLPTTTELSALDSSIVTAEVSGGNVVYTGLKEGSTQYQSGGLTIIIQVVAENLVPVALEIGENHSVIVAAGRIERNTEPSVADAVIEVDDQSVTFHGGQGTTGTDENYTGEAKALAQSLYRFEGNNTDGFTVSSKTEDGTIVYLNPSNTAGFPTGTASMKIVLSAGAEENSFYLQGGSYLHFWRDGKNRFDRVGTTSGYEAACSFLIYRPAQEGEDSSTELPGYIQVTDTANVADGGYYLIAAKYNGTYFLLHPSTSTSSKYSHVLKADPALGQVDYTIPDITYTLAITGKQAGVTDIAADGVIYRVTVTDGSAAHTHTWSDAWSSDGTHHWHECTAGGCTITSDNQKDGYALHVYSDSQTCQICGYIRPDGGNNSGSSSSSSGGNDKPPVSTNKNPSNDQTQTVVTPNATVNGSSAVSNVSSAAAKEMIDQAIRNNSDEIIIEPKIPDSVTSAKATIPSTAVGNISSQTKADLKVNTPVADVTIPNAALGELSARGTVSVAVERDGDNLTFTLQQGNTVVQTVSGGVTVEAPIQHGTPATVAVLIMEDGTRQVIRKSMTNKEAGTISIPLNGSARVEMVDNSKTFSDVSSGNWASDAIAFVSSHELFNGTGHQTFSPDISMTRGMLTVVLHNLENNPGTSAMPSFTDVKDNWYTDAITWATETGIVSGYPNGTFGPNDPITREQLAVVLWNYAGKPSAKNNYSGSSFQDADQISDYARTAMQWAIGSGILNGDGNGHLNPTDQATRAQAAQMLLNFARM